MDIYTDQIEWDESTFEDNMIIGYYQTGCGRGEGTYEFEAEAFINGENELEIVEGTIESIDFTPNEG